VKSNASAITAWVFGAFLVYLLSIGPMMRLSERYYWVFTPEIFETIYAPVGVLMVIPGFKDAMIWYLVLWEPHEVSDMSAGATAAATKPAPPAKTEKLPK